MIKKFKPAGVERFKSYILSLHTENPEKFPVELLHTEKFTIDLGGSVELLDSIDLNDKLKTAKALFDIVRKLNLLSAERDVGFWAWCSAYLFIRLCKRDKDGNYDPGELAKWIPEPNNWRRYYRHYLASIWRVYSTHRNNEQSLVVLLFDHVNTPGELWSQIAANQEFVTNPSIIDAIYQLFWDPSGNRRKYGAGGRSPRRLITVLKQFERTYDLSEMSGKKIIDLLPEEFNSFKSTAVISQLKKNKDVSLIQRGIKLISKLR